MFMKLESKDMEKNMKKNKEKKKILSYLLFYSPFPVAERSKTLVWSR